MKQNFIITQDEQTAQMLLASDFKLISHVGTTYTFLNDASKKFSFTNKMAFANILSL